MRSDSGSSRDHWKLELKTSDISDHFDYQDNQPESPETSSSVSPASRHVRRQPSGDSVDEMVVVLNSKRGQLNGSTTSSSNLRQTRGKNKYWTWLSTATFIVGVLILWNHVVNVMLPSDANSMVIPKYENKAAVKSPTGKQESQPVVGIAKTEKMGHNFHAAQALECRQSVVDFVINATDAKDECEGLKKAFDKTCGNTEGDEMPVHEATNKKAQAVKPQKPQAKHRFGERRTKKQRKNKQNQKKSLNRANHPRRLTEKWETIPSWQRWKYWLYETRRSTQDLVRYWFGAEKEFLFAEDEILAVWDDAELLVENDLEELVHADLKRSWENERRRRLKETSSKTSDFSNTTLGTDDPISPSSNKTKPSVKLSLPTLKKHASDAVIQDVLMLKQGDKLINQTSEAAKEAAESSNAMKKTAEAVSQVLNDPSSVEARTCCTSILNVYHENCNTDDEEDLSDTRLFLIVLVIACCGMVKSLIRHYQILWLPEAAGCIIVGIISGYVLMFFPHHDLSFDPHWFLRIMVPPIIFEAALSIDKRSFNRHVVPILLFAICGTLMATFVTAEVVHRGSKLLEGWCTPIPYIESLTFGALISSIDPIAVLSVLSNMGMTDQDTIFVLIFGESLLNDGVAIVLFETLVHFLDESLIIDEQAVAEAAIHFTIVALGSVLVGATGGLCATVYFWLFQGCQTPLVECLMFFCWALLPYYVCDGIGWSGIVSAVATGFVMDICIVGPRRETLDENGDLQSTAKTPPPRMPSLGVFARRNPILAVYDIFSTQEGHLSPIAKTHIGFVTGMIATAMETAIFAYLGLFLFSHRYHWSFFHALIAIFACCFSRALMIPSLSLFANVSTTVNKNAQNLFQGRNPNGEVSDVIIDKKMQFVLWFAGLRGAMSFALVENVPMFDSTTMEGSPFKAELKAMTSACIIFTIFVQGGYTHYVLENLGLAPERKILSDTSHISEEPDEELMEPLKDDSASMSVQGRRRNRQGVQS